MLQVLAKEVSHHYLPVSFYHQQAFPEKDRPADEEEFMAMSLKTKVVKAMDPSEKAAEDLEDMDIWALGKEEEKHRDKVLAMAILPVIDAFPIAACAGHSS